MKWKSVQGLGKAKQVIGRKLNERMDPTTGTGKFEKGVMLEKTSKIFKYNISVLFNKILIQLGTV